MRKIISVLFLVILGCGVAGYGWHVHHSLDSLSKVSSLVSKHLLAFEEEPELDLSTYLARGEDTERELAAALLDMQSADWLGAEKKREAAIEFTSRAISVIPSYTRFRMSNLRVGMSKRRLLEDERALAQETDPSLKTLASQRLEAHKEKYEEEQRDFYHQATAIGMHVEMLLKANDGVKFAYGESKGLDVATQEFMKQLM